MNLTHAEAQVLTSIEKARLEDTPSTRACLNTSAARFSDLLVDWSGAFESLAEKGLIELHDDHYVLSESGLPIARNLHAQRPDKYWYYYQKFYQAAHASAAHTRHCERVYGRDLCQEGMVDMNALEEAVAHLALKGGDRLIDLGCGAGGIAEYISDTTGAHVTGIDYSEPAIAVAEQRTRGKSSSFNAAISFDTLYWVVDLQATLDSIVSALVPGGQLGIFALHEIDQTDPPSELAADRSEVGQALGKLGLRYETHDYGEHNARFWRRFNDAVATSCAELRAEGNAFIATELQENVAEFLESVDAGTLTRYFYHVHID